MRRLYTVLSRPIVYFLNFTALGQWVMAHRFLRLYRKTHHGFVRVTISNYCHYFLRERITPIRSAFFRQICKRLSELEGNPWESGPPTFTPADAETLRRLESEEVWLEHQLANAPSDQDRERWRDRLDRVQARIELLRLLRDRTKRDDLSEEGEIRGAANA